MKRFSIPTAVIFASLFVAGILIFPQFAEAYSRFPSGSQIISNISNGTPITITLNGGDFSNLSLSCPWVQIRLVRSDGVILRGTIHNQSPYSETIYGSTPGYWHVSLDQFETSGGSYGQYCDMGFTGTLDSNITSIAATGDYWTVTGNQAYCQTGGGCIDNGSATPPVSWCSSSYSYTLCNCPANNTASCQPVNSGQCAYNDQFGNSLSCTPNETCVCIPPPIDFSMSNGGSISVTQGSSQNNSVSATLVSGTTSAVTFSVTSGLPAGVTASSITSCSPTCTTSLTINTNASATIGTSTVTVTGVVGTITRTTTFNLTVNALIVCGNGNIDSGEDCEGSNLNNETCILQGYVGGGTLLCNSSCNFNYSGCTNVVPPVCGNGILESGEQCDGTNINSSDTCITQGYDAGTLQCNSSCNFNYSLCTYNPPDCDTSPSCSSSCSAQTNTCSANNGTQTNCSYIAYSSGGTCNQISAPDQTCTQSNCSPNYACSNGTCVVQQSCGDNTCNNNETCSTCPNDCGACAVVLGCTNPSATNWNPTATQNNQNSNTCTFATPPNPIAGYISPVASASITIQIIDSTIRSIANFMLYAGGTLAVIFLTWSGIAYFLAGGDKAKIDSAKKTLKAGLIGALIVFGIGTILKTIELIGSGDITTLF